MNDQDPIDTLLQRQEADDSDFKSEQYRLDSDHEKSQFIKDIVAMANIPGAGSACIVIGVLERAGKATNVPGASTLMKPDWGESLPVRWTLLPDSAIVKSRGKRQSLGLSKRLE